MSTQNQKSDKSSTASKTTDSSSQIRSDTSSLHPSELSTQRSDGDIAAIQPDTPTLDANRTDQVMGRILARHCAYKAGVGDGQTSSRST